jgi:hypothetical protein
MRYRLEYNEKQRMFHLDNGAHEAFTYGWATLHPEILDELANPFIEMAYDIMKKQKQYSFDFVKCLFDKYVELVTDDIEQAINKSVVLN